MSTGSTTTITYYAARIFIPEGLTVNHPFFYIIQHTPSGRFYAGYCCYSGHCDSNKFMKKFGYQTSSKHIRDIISVDGLESFSILRIRHFNDSSTTFKYENKFLNRVDAMRNSKFINRSNGGFSFSGMGHSEETKKMISESSKGRIITAETRKKMGTWQIGRVLSEETKSKMSVSMKGKIRPPMSEEQKEKIRNALKGKPKSDEHKRRMSEVNTGKKLSPESIEKREKTRKLNSLIKKGEI